MSKNPSLSVIIPVFNEKGTMKEILRKVKKVKIKKEIIIVDDFSTDGTRKILKNIKDKNIRIIFQNKNYGKGYAIRTALNHVRGDIVIIQDADLEYEPEDYGRLIKPIISGKAKVVYGTRFPKGRKRQDVLSIFFLGNKILAFLSNLLYHAEITDESTCYKVFDSKTIKNINLNCMGFEFCPEITAKLSKKGYKITEIPIKYISRSKKQGKKIKYKDGFKAIWTLIKYKFID